MGAVEEMNELTDEQMKAAHAEWEKRERAASDERHREYVRQRAAQTQQHLDTVLDQLRSDHKSLRDLTEDDAWSIWSAMQDHYEMYG
jgi:hypothetical protein